MRSLATKLTLAFLAVGLVGLGVFVVLGSVRARNDFDRFVSARDQGVLVNALIEHYEKRGTWDGVAQALASRPPLGFYSRSIVLADANGTVIMGTARFTPGRALPPDEANDGEPILVNDRLVGYVRFRTVGTPPPIPSEAAFLSRIAQSAMLTALVSTIIALALGLLLARTLTQPIRELTAATRAVAAGDLGRQVHVRSNDEIGRLATAFNQLSTDLARNSTARKQMTADLAHDLRTPLSVLRGYTEGLKDGRVQGDPALYAVMHGEIEHLQSLVDDLRTLSLADAGELSLNRRKVSPTALLERTALAYFMQAEQQNVALRLDAAEDLPAIDVDAVRMTQVLNNLVSNALRFTRKGEVVIGARKAQDKRVLLTVRDTGDGIPPEQLPHVFERFYRGDASRTRTRDDSTGLGLAIARAIVEAHGGTISVTSAPGRGSVFEMAFAAA